LASGEILEFLGTGVVDQGADIWSGGAVPSWGRAVTAQPRGARCATAHVSLGGFSVLA